MTGIAIDATEILSKHLGFDYKLIWGRTWGEQLPNGQFFGSMFDVCISFTLCYVANLLQHGAVGIVLTRA